MISGLVFHIQRYSIHDGPGIRTTVFLKGCPLTCWWCHNPEGRLPQPEVAVIGSRCIGCGGCWRVCPQRACNGHPAAAPAIAENCTRCGRCVAECPTGARQMVGRRLAPGEVVDEVLRDRVFFEQSGGGVTFSGGEPLAQPQFLLAALAECRKHGLHTAVDTSGYAPWDDLAAAASVTDLFLFDMKVIDDRRHLLWTGVSNRSLLDNLRRLDQIHPCIWIRIPLIAGHNDDAENLEQTARFVARLQHVRQVSLLPYHRLGRQKASRILGVEQPAGWPPASSPGTEQMQWAAEFFRRSGVEVSATV